MHLLSHSFWKLGIWEQLSWRSRLPISPEVAVKTSAGAASAIGLIGAGASASQLAHWPSWGLTSLRLLECSPGVAASFPQRRWSSRTRQKPQSFLWSSLGCHGPLLLLSSTGHTDSLTQCRRGCTGHGSQLAGIFGGQSWAGFHTMAMARGPFSGSLLAVLTPKQGCLDLLYLLCPLVKLTLKMCP